MKAENFVGSTKVSTQNEVKTFSVYDDSEIGSYELAGVNEASQALALAKKASVYTKASTIAQRCNWLLDVANTLKEQKELFAQAIVDDVGKPLKFARIEVERCIETITIASDTMRTMHGETFNADACNSGRKAISYFKREPAGVIVAITPFNFPLNLVAHKLAPALVAGNAVILKPTKEAPKVAFLFAKAFIESEYAIKDALSLLYTDRDATNLLVQSPIPRVISFTGSLGVGKIIMQNAGVKRVSLELGGNAATYVDESADAKLAASKCVLGAFVNSGQVCISLQRIYVHEAVYEEFAQELLEETKSLRVGSPYDEETFLGPLVNDEAVQKAVSWTKSAVQEGARYLLEPSVEGRVFTPCIMTDVTNEMNVVCEEAFAPIVSLIKVKSYEEAKAHINDSDYGLQGSIFTNNLSHAKDAIEQFECGGVVVNDIPTLRFDIQPYGGLKNSGIGREGPRFAIEEFSEIKSVVIN